MAKCAICKAVNMKAEAAKHPNTMTLSTLNQMLGKIRDRNPSVIASICDYHRKPLVLNTVLIDLFDTKELVYIAKREAERGGFY